MNSGRPFYLYNVCVCPSCLHTQPIKIIILFFLVFFKLDVNLSGIPYSISLPESNIFLFWIFFIDISIINSYFSYKHTLTLLGVNCFISLFTFLRILTFHVKCNVYLCLLFTFLYLLFHINSFFLSLRVCIFVFLFF